MIRAATPIVALTALAIHHITPMALAAPPIAQSAFEPVLSTGSERSAPTGRPAVLTVIAQNDKTDPEYAHLKQFLAFFVVRYHELAAMPPEQRPIAMLEALEKKSMKQAHIWLRQAIHDSVDESFDFDRSEVEKLDAELQRRSIVTLTDLRRRYWATYTEILKRQRINDQTEYRLIRNVLDNTAVERPAEERKLLERMVSAFKGS